MEITGLRKLECSDLFVPTKNGTKSVLECTIELGKKYSLSNALAQIPSVGKYFQDGGWGRVASDAVGGANPYTALLDAGNTLLGTPESSKAIYQAAAGTVLAGGAQGFQAFFPKGSTGRLSVAPDLVGPTLEVGVKAGAKLAGASAEIGEEAASGLVSAYWQRMEQ